MELPEATTNGLKLLQSSNTINDEIFSQLLDSVVSDATCQTKSDGKSLGKLYGSSKPEVIKAAYAHLTSLFVEAARNKFDAEKLLLYLDSMKFSGQRAEELTEIYGKYAAALIEKLGSLGNCLPCIVDVDWRIDYCLKSSTDDQIGECLYHVRLSTKKHGKMEYVKFTCTILQLQELVYKLRDAVRHMDKIANI